MTSIPDLSTIPHHPILEEVVDTLCTMTQNKNPEFFRVIASFFFGKMASSMRACIRSSIAPFPQPVNIYACALATSGFGKNYSVNIMEQQFLAGFVKRFKRDTFPTLADQTMWKMAIETAAVTGETEEVERQKLEAHFRYSGPLPFTFEDATPAAVKQIRDKLILADAGALTLQIDEIGSNLLRSTDILTVFLDLYDMGLTKGKLVKNTKENERFEELEGHTPTNMLLFGTPTKLQDNGIIHNTFMSFLDTGYARRLLFAWGEADKSKVRLDPKERFDRLTRQAQNKSFKKLANHFTSLADPAKHGWEMTMDENVTLAFLEYQHRCELLADRMKEHEEIRRAEMTHRHSKALKLAGALAFVDESLEINLDHFWQAVKIVEESGQQLDKILNPEPSHIKLARYLADVGTKKTLAELLELPYYKTAPDRDKQNMIRYAASWGYKNHIIIRKTFEEGIEFLEGESLKETDLNHMIFSYSDHEAYNYVTEPAPFNQLHMLAEAPNMHWANHRFTSGHRCDQNVIPGFNMIVVDADGEVPLDFVHEQFKDYEFLTYTTKRHSDETHRFRLIMPINYLLELDKHDYHDFMDNVLNWLPFKSDDTARQRSKKWLTNANTVCHYNRGALFDALPFIPKTTKNELHQQEMKSLGSLDNLERWFAQRFISGDRSNQMIKYAYALVDSGMGYVDVERAVLSFNARLANGLSESELRKTVLVSVAKKCAAIA
jgi:hypothetical protein